MALNDENGQFAKQEDYRRRRPQKTKTQAFNELAAYLNAHTKNTNIPALTRANMQQRWRTYKTKKFQLTLKKGRTETGLGMTEKELRQGLSIQAKLDKLCSHFARIEKQFAMKANIRAPATLQLGLPQDGTGCCRTDSKYDEDKESRSEESDSAESSDEHLGASGSDNNDQSYDADEFSARNDFDDDQDEAADGPKPTDDGNEASSKNTGVIEPDDSFEPTPPEGALWTTGEEDELPPCLPC
ncbi:hypothetical protein L916_13905 [Phytophthora nicotianae]|uniref:Myb/SANT-like domain-containing protein n=1 Tax=Phytophthora nicotianae TaxID=4792 RepID=W2IHG9_PHYNI|nr:hypothetical protein L916_13905 [Phytophthora nicotianae]